MSTPFVSFTSRTTLQSFCTIYNYPTQGMRHAFYTSPEKIAKVLIVLYQEKLVLLDWPRRPISVLLGEVHPRESRPASTHNESIYTIAYIVTLGFIALEACGNQLQWKCWRLYTSRRIMQLLTSAPQQAMQGMQHAPQPQQGLSLFVDPTLTLNHLYPRPPYDQYNDAILLNTLVMVAQRLLYNDRSRRPRS